MTGLSTQFYQMEGLMMILNLTITAKVFLLITQKSKMSHSQNTTLRHESNFVIHMLEQIILQQSQTWIMRSCLITHPISFELVKQNYHQLRNIEKAISQGVFFHMPNA